MEGIVMLVYSLVMGAMTVDEMAVRYQIKAEQQASFERLMKLPDLPYSRNDDELVFDKGL
jgi:hypothetical protein